MTGKQKTLLGASIFFLLAFCYMLVKPLLAHWVSLPGIPGGPYGKAVPLFGFTFFYLAYVRGWKSTLYFALFMLVFAWGCEDLSIHTGFPYGHYYYSNQLGFKLDQAPVMLGVLYFGLLVIGPLFTSNLLAEGTFFGNTKNLKRLLFASFIGSILVAGFDMLIDPVDATRLGEWVWTINHHTGYYGIPYINYLGYLICFTPIFFIYGLINRKVNAQPQGPVTLPIAALPLLFYFLNFVLYGLAAPGGVDLVGCFTIVFPLTLTADKLLKYFSQNKTATVG